MKLMKNWFHCLCFLALSDGMQLYVQYANLQKLFMQSSYSSLHWKWDASSGNVKQIYIQMSALFLNHKCHQSDMSKVNNSFSHFTFIFMVTIMILSWFNFHYCFVHLSLVHGTPNGAIISIWCGTRFKAVAFCISFFSNDEPSVRRSQNWWDQSIKMTSKIIWQRDIYTVFYAISFE